MDEIEFDSLYAAGRTYQDRRLGAGSLCDRCEHGHIYRRRDARDVAVYCRSLRVPHDRSARGNRSAELSVSGADGRCRDVAAPLTRDRDRRPVRWPSRAPWHAGARRSHPETKLPRSLARAGYSLPVSLFEPIFEALNRAQVRYVVVGGFATVLHGHARLTADIDLVIDLSPDTSRRRSSNAASSARWRR